MLRCAALPTDPTALCAAALAATGRDARHDDDVAVLAVRVGGIPSSTLELTVRATPESLSAMRHSLEEWLAAAGAGDDESYDVLVATGEAAANAVEHAYGPDDATFELVAELADDEVLIEVRDSGNWRPPRGANRGRGLGLMETLMDSAHVEPSDAGTVVRMRRRLGTAA
jgi:anti-sigma regulatory factor (Ser/Thr protein kinase)